MSKVKMSEAKLQDILKSQTEVKMPWVIISTIRMYTGKNVNGKNPRGKNIRGKYPKGKHPRGKKCHQEVKSQS